MSHYPEGLFREVHAAGKSHVAVSLRRVDNALTDVAPVSRRGKRHGGIHQRIAELRGNLGSEVSCDDHMLSQRKAGPALFGASGVVDRRSFTGSDRVPNFEDRSSDRPSTR